MANMTTGNFDENTITQAVLAALSNAQTPRMREISQALVRHLHAFVREVRPSQAEWLAGIDFLTSTGQMCSPTRQEFILLSDTLGVSMLVDAINHAGRVGATETTVLGPFYVEHPRVEAAGADISGGRPGEKLLFEGTVQAPDGSPVADAWVDTWQADADGYYDVQRPADGAGLNLRARFRTDAEGGFWFRSLVPSFYPIPDDGPVGHMLRMQGRHPYRPAHVHFMISAPGFETLITHLFVAGDPYLGSDAVFGVKESLIRRLERQPAGPTPGGHVAEEPTAVLGYNFVLAPAP